MHEFAHPCSKCISVISLHSEDWYQNEIVFQCGLEWLQCLYDNMLLECAEFIAPQIFMLFFSSTHFSWNTHIFLSASHFSVLCLSSHSYRYPHSSFFLNHSFFIALSVPSILLPARLQPFFLTSFSFLPVFQPWLFSPSFTIILTLSCPVSSTFHGLLFLPLCPFFHFYITPNPHQHQSLFPLPTIFFSICNLSHFLESSISHWPCFHLFSNLSFFFHCPVSS